MKFAGSLLIVILLTAGIFAQNQTQIFGTVSNGKNPVRNVSVFLLNTDDTVFRETKTDANGKFIFSNVPNGEYKIKTEHDFDPQIKSSTSNIFSVNGKSIRHDINGIVYTQTEVIEEEVNINISAGTSQPLAEVSKTVNIISESEIRKRNEISLVDALRTIPGFRIQQLGGFGRAASIKTRGLRNQDTAVLIDGFRLRDPAAITGDASPFLSDIGTANIDRIEVLRGSGSSIYGTNAIGGVVDFRTPVPESGINGSLIGEYGGLGMKRFRGNFGDGTKDGKFGFNLGISRVMFSEGIDGEDDAAGTNFQGRADYNPFANMAISGRVFVSDAFVRLNSSPDTLGNLPEITQIIDAEEGVNFTADANDPDNFQYSKFFSGQMSFTQIINSELVFTGGYQGLKTSRENENGGLGIGFQPFGGIQTSLFNGQIHTLNGKFNWSPTANNLVVFGYEYELEKYGNEGFGPTPAGDFFVRADQSSHAVFAQNLLGLFDDRLQLAGGFRAQRFSVDAPEFSLNNAPFAKLTFKNPPASYTFDGAASYYFPSTRTKLRVHAGNGYRVPSLFERLGTFYSSFSQSFTALGDPRLKPERSIAFDGGIDQSFSSERVRLSATYFYTKLTDTIGFGLLPQPDPFGRDNFASGGGYLNAKGGIARGAEFSGSFKPANSTDIFASYTFTNSDQREPQVSGSRIIDTLGIADHQFTLVVTQKFGDRLSVNFDLAWASSYLAPIFSNSIFSTRIYRFDGARRADITGRYELPAFDERVKFVFFGSVENIFDDVYFENGFRTIGRNGRFGLGLNF